MGSLFGIADLPISTIDKAIDINGEIQLPMPERTSLQKSEVPLINLERSPEHDGLVNGKNGARFSKSIIKMRNGFGKLMSHIRVPKLK